MSFIGNKIGALLNRRIKDKKGDQSAEYIAATKRMETYNKFQDTVKNKIQNTVFKNSGVRGYLEEIQHGDEKIIEKVLFVAPLKSIKLGIKNNIELFNESDKVNEIVKLINNTDFDRLNAPANRRNEEGHLATLFKKKDNSNVWVFTYKKKSHEITSKKGIEKINKALDSARKRMEQRKAIEQNLAKSRTK